ncbi:MAG: ABC transporter permease [Clostridiaceae bacterium]|nr:ABC transporter permease [Clostridiaceae bacterium]
MATKKKINFGDKSSLIVLIALIILLGLLEPAFATVNNAINILQQVTVVAILALGVNIVIFTGGIDISVGAVVALSGIVLGKIVVDAGLPMFVGIVLSLLVALFCGVFNGVMISKFKLQPMIATLAMQSMARGLALTIAGGKTISGYPESFLYLGQGNVFGTKIPVQIVLMIALFIIFHFIMRYRKFGRYIYAIGGNEEASRLSGINVDRYKILAYSISGLMAGVTSLVLVAKLNSAQPVAGLEYEMDAIASCVIGGSSLLGGQGSVWGTFIGAIIIVIIRNGLNLMGISSNLQKFVIGLVILLAVLADSFRNRKKLQ